MRTSCAALVCVCILALGVASAAAETIDMPYDEAGFVATWPSFEAEAAGIMVRCPLTFQGTFHGPSMQVAVGAPVASVTTARMGACTGGSASVVTASLPWQVKFNGFTGTLPAITSVRLKLVNGTVATQAGSLSCLVRATEAQPVSWIVNLASEEAVSTAFDPTTGIRLEGPGLCAFGGQARLKGRSGPLRTALGDLTFTMVQGPAANAPWVVSVGDSFISGEAGRWASNTTTLSRDRIDRLRARAYFDNSARTAESVPGCHRASTAEIHIGWPGGPQSKNFGCSGATTRSQTINGVFKPGLDLADPLSQAAWLREWARAGRALGQPVRMVAVSIGGNDFHFAEIVAACVAAFAEVIVRYCKDDSNVTRYISATEIARNTTAIQLALREVHRAMVEANYADSEYTIVVQNYPWVLASSGDFRPTNRAVDGCPFYDADADWAGSQVLPAINGAVWTAVGALEFTNVRRLDITEAFSGHYLCERRATTLEGTGFDWWGYRDVIRTSEWVNRVRAIDSGDLKRQESLHPNSFGQLAIRSCLREAYNLGAVRSGRCQPNALLGVSRLSEPGMRFIP